MSVAKWIVAVLLMAVPMWAGDDNDANGENRCDDLGSICVCAESLDTNSGSPYGDSTNPPNSTSKECGTMQTNETYTAVAETGMPTGNSVGFVWRIDNDPSEYTNAKMAGIGATITNGTICSRLYHTFSSDFPEMQSGAIETRAKLAQLTRDDNKYSQTEWYHSSQSRYVTANNLSGVDQSIGWFGIPDAGTQIGPTVHLSDCRTSWCRVEQCWDITNGSIRTRSRITVLNTGTQETLIGTPDTHSGAVVVSEIMIGNLHRQLDTVGFRYASYGIQAQWPTPQDSTVWIGAATEVEGGAAPVPKPPAPSLLD